MMVSEIVGYSILLASMVIAGLLLHRIIKLDLTLSCLATGLIAGFFIPTLELDTGIRATNLQALLFYVILPVLIFEAAWQLKPQLLKRWLFPILLLAIPGVLISCVITALIVYVGIGNPEHFPWIAAILTGAILAATDPISVVAQLKSAKAPNDLTTLFEGESLFNDAAVVVLFTLVLMYANNGMPSHSNPLSFFAIVFFGGLMLGALSGLITAILVLLLGSIASTHIVLIFSAFTSFYIAEDVFHVSGIMSVFACAFVSRIALKEKDADFLKAAPQTWEWLGLFFNGLVFCLMGLVIVLDMFSDQWLAMLIAIAAALIARFISVYICAWLSQPLSHAIAPSWRPLLVWGGLRGAIAIVLVLSLPSELPYWWTIQSMVFGVVLFNLLIQGSSNPYLLRKLPPSQG